MQRRSSAADFCSVRQITDGVKPTLSELEKFEDQPEGIDLEVVTESGEHAEAMGSIRERL